MQRISKVGILFCVIGAIALIILVPTILRFIVSSQAQASGDNSNNPVVYPTEPDYQYSINQGNAIIESDPKYKKDGSAFHPSTFDAIQMIKQKDSGDANSFEEGSLTWMARSGDVQQACIMLVNGSGDVMDTHTHDRHLNQGFYNFKKNGSGWYVDSFFLMNGYQDNCPAGGSAPQTSQS